MNSALEKLLKNDLLSNKDRYEIRQIFNIVNEDKKKNILKNFHKMLEMILNIKQEMKEKQEIFLGKSVSNIEKSIKLARDNAVKNVTISNIQTLKKTI